MEKPVEVIIKETEESIYAVLSNSNLNVAVLILILKGVLANLTTMLDQRMAEIQNAKESEAEDADD